LGVTVSSTISRSSFVAGELAQSTVGGHLNKVQSAVETTGERRHVNIEGEFLVQEVEHLVVGVVLIKQVNSGSDVRYSLKSATSQRKYDEGLTSSHELQAKFIAAGGNTVGGLVVGTVECASSSTSLTIGAQGCVPF